MSGSAGRGLTVLARRWSLAARWPVAVFVAAWCSLPQAQEIYRCERDGGVVFSDLPCDDEAEPYRAGRSLSVIEPAEGLDGVAEENRAFVSERRARLAERRQRAERSRAAAEMARLRAEAARAARAGNRLIIAPGRRIDAPFPNPSDSRNAGRRSEREDNGRDNGRDNRRIDRRTLLSRSGSDRPILPREPPNYQ